MLETWLTILLRLALVVFVGFCCWWVLGSVSQKFSKRMFNVTANSSAEQGNESPPADSNGTPFFKLMPIVIGLLLGLSILAGFQWFLFNRFRDAISQIDRLNGSIQFQPESKSLFASFLFGNATIDLSETSLTEENFPKLHWIPRTKSLRLAATGLENELLNHVAKCQNLIALDLSGNPIDETGIAKLKPLEKLETLILNGTSVSNETAVMAYFSRLQKLEMVNTQDS